MPKNLNKRRSKFWFKNEKETLIKLGLVPVPGSGSGIKKEDGENADILCQLKSTGADSITIKRVDIEKLIYHADQVRKIPVFAIQFLGLPPLIALPPSELKNISSYMSGDGFEKAPIDHIKVSEKTVKPKKVKSSNKGYIPEWYKKSKSEDVETRSPQEIRNEKERLKKLKELR